MTSLFTLVLSAPTELRALSPSSWTSSGGEGEREGGDERGRGEMEGEREMGEGGREPETEKRIWRKEKRRKMMSVGRSTTNRLSVGFQINQDTIYGAFHLPPISSPFQPPSVSLAPLSHPPSRHIRPHRPGSRITRVECGRSAAHVADHRRKALLVWAGRACAHVCKASRRGVRVCSAHMGRKRERPVDQLVWGFGWVLALVCRPPVSVSLTKRFPASVHLLGVP